MITGKGTMWDLVERRAQESPDHPMLFDASGRSLTFAELRDQAEQVAAALAALGVTPGMVVSWQLPTWIDTVVLSMALSRLGAVQNPIIHLYREREVGFAINEAQPALLVIPGSWRGFDYPAMARALTQSMQDGPEVLVLEGSLPPELTHGDPALLPPADSFQAGQVRWIYYTSGSTADPKGVRHTDQALISGGRGLALALDMGPDDVGSIAFPYAHIGGPDYLVTMLSLGFPAVLLESFVPSEALEVFRRHNVTMVGGSTAFYQALLAEQRKQPGRPILPTLRLMSGGGAPKPPELHYEVKAEIGGRGIVHGYGMTEVPMIANGSPHDTDEQLANTDGRPIEGAQVRVMKPDGTPARPGEDGEVQVLGPMVMVGYTDPALDAEAFAKGGWFRTGDLGCLREDGHLALTGRLKDVIVRKGENVSAKEVEDVLYTHPWVTDVAVIGLPEPSRGELVCAVVRLTPGAGALTLEDVAAYCREKGLMNQKIPEQLEIRIDMPRAATGKIVKQDLRETYVARPPASNGPSR